MKTARLFMMMLGVAAGCVGWKLIAAEQPKAELPRAELREIAVFGAVGKPGKLVLPEGGLTVLGAIARVGGFTPNSGRSASRE